MITHVFIPDVAYDVVVVARVAHKLSLEESYVDDGRVEVNELEDEHFEGEVVVEIWLGPVHLWKFGMSGTLISNTNYVTLLGVSIPGKGGAGAKVVQNLKQLYTEYTKNKKRQNVYIF